jgi:hypothetical protein
VNQIFGKMRTSQPALGFSFDGGAVRVQRNN